MGGGGFGDFVGGGGAEFVLLGQAFGDLDQVETVYPGLFVEALVEGLLAQPLGQGDLGQWVVKILQDSRDAHHLLDC